MKVAAILFTLLLTSSVQSHCQGKLADTFYNDHNRNKVMISPEPIPGGAYFWIKFPENEQLKDIELLDMDGTKAEATPLLFSKMGMYMPKVRPGDYLLKVNLRDDTIIKRICVE